MFGKKTSGATCQGTWEYDALIDIGKGTFTCSDGDSATNLNFFARGKEIRAIKGVAITTDGNRLQLWSSPDLSAYFKQELPEGPHPTYKCGEAWIPLPVTFPDFDPDAQTKTD